MELVGTLIGGHRGRVKTCFSGDCLRIATSSLDFKDNIRLWDAHSRDLVDCFENIGAVFELEFSCESTLLLAVATGEHFTEARTLIVWELGTKRQLLKWGGNSIRSAIFSTDSLHIIAVVKGAIQVVSLESQDVIISCSEGMTQMPFTTSLIRHPAYSFGLSATSAKDVLSVRNVCSNEVIAEYPLPGSREMFLVYVKVSINSDGSKLAISQGKLVDIWEIISNAVILSFPAYGAVNYMSFNSASNRIAVVSDIEGVCQIFAIPSGEMIQCFTEGPGTCVSATYQQHSVGVVLL